MTTRDVNLSATDPRLVLSIARCRVVLSVTAIIAWSIGPGQFSLSGLAALLQGTLTQDALALAALSTHLVYGGIIYYLTVRYTLTGRTVLLPRVVNVTTFADMILATGIALCARGYGSLFFFFFVFAVLAAGFSAGFRQAMVVTTMAVATYLALIGVSAAGTANFYVIGPPYLAIVGYLVGYLGQKRLTLERELQEIAAVQQRNRIARDLHDNHTQVLAAINLQLESCRELLRRGATDDALAALTTFQGKVSREYDELRRYTRLLASQKPFPMADGSDQTIFTVSANFTGSGPYVEHILAIVREGVINIRRHARAAEARVRAVAVGGEVRITIDDDGVGFGGEMHHPWSIRSRVSELGGRMQVAQRDEPGAHLRIVIPQV